MAAPNLTNLTPKLRTIAKNLPRVAAKYGFQVRITSGYRSRTLQAKLYNDYVRGVSQYPAQPPGYSMHEKGRAIDVLSTAPQSLVDLLTSVGLQWGGPDDPIHFEFPGKIATGASRTQKVMKVKGKESTLGRILDWTSWIPGPVGWASMIADIWL